MKFFIFKKENNDFDDILHDQFLKNKFTYKVRWEGHLLLGKTQGDMDPNLESYLTLKYGEMLLNYRSTFPNLSPVMHKDYNPGKLPKFPINKRS
jgi:hypothetical protein